MVFSLYGNPLHKGHVEYASNARKLAGPDGLVYAIVNNDRQAVLKKGYAFVPEQDRVSVVGALRFVDRAFLSIDTDRSVCATLQMVCDTAAARPTHWFNEGDVTPESPCPEEAVCGSNNIEVVYGGAPKVQSSSWILEGSVRAAYAVMRGGMLPPLTPG